MIKRERRSLHTVLTSAAAIVAAAMMALPAHSAPGARSLRDLSLEVQRIYNAGDAAALHALLAPPLKAKYTVEAVRQTLTACRALTQNIERISWPTGGTRHYGFFAVYAKTSTWEMILEIDNDEKLLYFVITDDVTEKEQRCTVNNLS
jgi:hypothetical protein